MVAVAILKYRHISDAIRPISTKFGMLNSSTHAEIFAIRKIAPFIWYKNIAGRFFGLVTKHMSSRSLKTT